MKCKKEFLKGYGLLSFVKSMNKNIGKNISKKLSRKHSYKFFDHVKQSAKGILKTSSKRGIQKLSETTADLIGNKIAHIIIKVSNLHCRIIWKLLERKQKTRILITKYLKKDINLQKKRQKTIDDLRLI